MISTDKIRLIIKREYTTRVRKKIFIYTTLLGPLFFLLISFVPIWLAQKTSSDMVIDVISESPREWFQDQFVTNPHLSFCYGRGDENKAKMDLALSTHEGVLFIPNIDIYNPKGIKYFSSTAPSIETQRMLEQQLSTVLERIKLQKSGIPDSIINNLKTSVKIQTVSLFDNEIKDNHTGVNTAVGLTAALLIYIFVFMYGIQVMRGVIEEKTNRILEIIITSVKPFELMMGKIIGIALVALTQFVIWILLVGILYALIASFFQLDMYSNAQISQTLKHTPDIRQAMEMNKMVSAISQLEYLKIVICFIFYFSGGYLLYASLFAAIGAAVDNEENTQQFILPITFPLIISFVFMQTMIADPQSDMSVFMSIFPLTSPISMMVRLPFGVPDYQLILSIFLLIITFIISTGISAKIYRVGILMYGKKASWREISKWLFYKE